MLLFWEYVYPQFLFRLSGGRRHRLHNPRLKTSPGGKSLAGGDETSRRGLAFH